MHLCNREGARTKTTVVVNLISHKQLCRNSLHSRNKVVFKAASPANSGTFAGVCKLWTGLLEWITGLDWTGLLD